MVKLAAEAMIAKVSVVVIEAALIGAFYPEIEGEMLLELPGWIDCLLSTLCWQSLNSIRYLTLTI